MRLLATLLGAAMLCAATQAPADGPIPKPFSATYAVSYRGIGAGSLTFRFSHDPASGRYTYETIADPSALARLFVSGEAIERSVMQIGPDGVRPLEWQLDDGKARRNDDGRLVFDWQAGTVRGEVEGERVELAAVPGLQDRSSIQVEVATALLRGEEPGTIPLVDDNRIKRYTYRKLEDTTVESALGHHQAVLYESTREGSSRVSRFWMVPELEYLPARAEQIRKGKVETVMVLKEVSR